MLETQPHIIWAQAYQRIITHEPLDGKGRSWKEKLNLYSHPLAVPAEPHSPTLAYGIGHNVFSEK